MRVAVTFLIVSVLLVAAVVGSIVFCSVAISDGDKRIASLDSQITGLDSRVSDLQGQAANLNSQLLNLTSANLATSLGVTEVPYNSPSNFPTPLLYNHLYIKGSVTNVGQGTAYNTGLHVVAYSADGGIEVNMTVPLVSQVNATGNENTDFSPVFGTNNATQIYGNDSLTLGILHGGETAQISLGIYHEGTVTRWDITPVWTDIHQP